MKLLLFAFSLLFSVTTAHAAEMRQLPSRELTPEIQQVFSASMVAAPQRAVETTRPVLHGAAPAVPNEQIALIRFLNQHFVALFSLAVLFFGFLFAVRHRLSEISIFGFKISLSSKN